MKTSVRKFALPIAFLVVGLPLGVGVVMAIGDHSQSSDDSAFVAVSQGAGGVKYERRAQPRWEDVTTFASNGPMAQSFTIAPRAIQWKAQWSCRAGAFKMTVGRPSQPGKVLASSSCPDTGGVSSTGTGPGMLQVDSAGPWSVTIRQEVDTALVEPPLGGMTKAALVASGRFHGVQKHGEGTVSVYRLPSGRLALRFEHFFTSASPGLRIWVSHASDVRSTLEARQSHHIDAGAVRSTLGSFNQMLPTSVSAGDARTIVIWCPTVLIAFGAAPLAIR